MRALRSASENTARCASGTTTPEGIGTSTKVTRPRVIVGTAIAPPSSRPRAFRRSMSRLSRATSTRASPATAPAFSGAACSDSSKGMDASVNDSSMDSRAPRSGMAKTQA